MVGQSINECPTEVDVGGSFRVIRNGATDWFFYIGKTEVTADLFNAVMRSAGQPAKQFSGAGDLPAAGLTYLEVQNFIDAYNRWLSNNAGDLLPSDDSGLKAFLRLPTEQEWEFAARGGRKVSADALAGKTPYGDKPLEEYEWFGGPTSSHNELQSVGKLKPNPLGLHDMLGNASEMTGSPFQLKAGQGPAGGLVKRGGNFRMRGEDLRSSLRGEFSQYDVSGDRKGVPELGFRLVLAAPIFFDIERIEELEELFKEEITAGHLPSQSENTADSPNARGNGAPPLTRESVNAVPTPVAAFPSTSAARIKAPFGMKWGESASNVMRLIDQASAKIFHREFNADSREIWSVAGIPQEGLSKTRFFFSERGLEEIRLHFERPDLSHERILRWVQIVKEQADRKYGSSVSVSPEDLEGNGQTLAAWRWASPESSLLLMHYLSEEDGQRADQVVVGYSRNPRDPASTK
jgi:hypothetical protein